MRYKYKLNGRTLRMKPQSPHPYDVNIDDLINDIATRDISLRGIAAELGLDQTVLSAIWIQFATAEQRAAKMVQANRRKGLRSRLKWIAPEISPEELAERRAMVDRERAVIDERLSVREPRTYHVGGRR